MLLWKKLKNLNRYLGKMRYGESRLLKEMCISDDYKEVKEILDRIINYFYTLPGFEKQAKDLNSLGRMIYEFRFKSVYGEAIDIKHNAENVLYNMEQQGESHFNLESILYNYAEGMQERREDAIKYINIYILGSLCLTVSFIGVISNLIINLGALTLGTILMYKSLSYLRLSAIKSIKNNQKILTDKIIDIRLEKKSMRRTSKEPLPNRTRKPTNHPLSHSFKGEPIKERIEQGQSPMKKERKLDEMINKY